MKKNIMWNSFGGVFYSFCQWLITIVVVHLSSFEDAGYLSLAMTTSSSFSAISLFSMRNYQVSDVTDEYNTNTYVGSRIITCIIAFVGCTIIGFGQNSPQPALCISAFMLIRTAEAITDVLHGVNQKYNRYDLIGKSYILRGIVTIIFFISIFLLTDNLVITLYGMAFVNLAVAFSYDWVRTQKLEKIIPIIKSRSVYNLMKTCVPLVIFTFLLSLENLIPKMMLEKKFGAEQLGIYSSLASPTLVVQVFASVVFNPFLPKFSILYNSGGVKQLKNTLHRIYLLLIIMSIVVSGGAMILGKIGLTILFGKSILEYYYLFMPIVGCTILTAIICVVSAIVVALRKIKWLLLGMIADFLICIALAKPFVDQYEKNGVSLIQLLVLSIYIVFMIIICEITVFKKGKKNENRN